MSLIIVYADGACRGNPGPMAIGASIQTAEGVELSTVSALLGQGTNNVAEYPGLLAALAWALEQGLRNLHIRSDSELLVRQLKGEYRVKNPGLQPLFQEARERVARIGKVTFEHVRREFNKEADRLANLAMDEAARPTGQ